MTDISETIFLLEFLSLSGVSIDQIKTNKQNFTKVVVDNLMEKKLFISLIRLCDKTAVKCSDVRKRKVA